MAFRLAFSTTNQTIYPCDLVYTKLGVFVQIRSQNSFDSIKTPASELDSKIDFSVVFSADIMQAAVRLDLHHFYLAKW